MPILNMITQGSGGGGGGNIGEPLNLTVTTIGLDATITWEDNEIGTIPPTTFQKSELVRKIGSAPTSPSDGTLVVTETVKDTYKTTGYVDQGLTDGETYYYRVFSYSDLGGISYCDAVSVIPSSGGWQPGANTIVYYPFTSQTTVADMSGNNHNLTNGGAMFGTFQGVDCAYLNGSSYLETSDTITVPDGCTILAWCYTQNTSGDFRRIVDVNTGSRSLMLLYSTGNVWEGYNVWLGGRPTTNATSYYGAWYLVAGTGLSNVQNLYIYGANTAVDITDNQDTYGMTNATLCVGADSSSSHGDNFIGGVSNLIIESRVRTAQEISDYYNQTKANYGIS